MDSKETIDMDLEQQVEFSKAEEDASYVDFNFSDCVAPFQGKEKLFDMAFIMKLSETEHQYQALRDKVEAIDPKFVKNVVQNPLI